MLDQGESLVVSQRSNRTELSMSTLVKSFFENFGLRAFGGWQRYSRPGMEGGIFAYDESTAELFDVDESKEPRGLQQGTVKWFNEAKGYGFISLQNGEDVFVHYSAISASGFKSLKEGQVVQVDTVKQPAGWQAAHVRPR